MSSIISTCDCERLGCRFLTSQQKRQVAAYCALLLLPSIHTNMPLLYADSLQNDDDVCNLLAALRIGDGPQSPATPAPDCSSAVTHHSWPIVADNQDNNCTPIRNACDPRSTQQVDGIITGTLRSAAQVPSAPNISPADEPRQPSRNPLPSASIDLSGK